MTPREELLQAVENEDKKKFIELTVSKRGGSRTDSAASSIEEILSELSRKQLEEVWTSLQTTTTATLLNFQDVADSPELKTAGLYLQGVVSVAMATLQLSDVELPAPLLQTALILHGVLLSVPGELEGLQKGIARLCEAWWAAGRDGAQDLTSQTFMFLLEKSLTPGATGADVKRVCVMASCLERINLDEESSSTLKNLLLHTLMAPAYLKLKTESKKFFRYLFGLNVNFIEQLHKTIKVHIPTSSNAVLALYGQIYFEAWKASSGLFQLKIEQSCIQDLMYHAVHAQRGARSLASQLAKVLTVIHHQKLQRGVDEMLLQLYEPILWRSLKVANADVRANAAVLLFDVFPLQNPQASNEDNDALLQKQFDIFNSLLCDPAPSVRVAAVAGVCAACRVYWELIPAPAVRALLSHLLRDLAWDAASPDVRAAVIKGACTLLDNPLIHPLLKSILPEMRNLVHDTSEKVRIAFLDLLLKVKGMRAIKFWSIVPLEHLLARLEMDGPGVGRRIVRLLLHSFLPLDKPPEVQVQRAVAMLNTNQAAARRFYQYVPNHLGLQGTVKLISTLARCVHSCVKTHADVVNSSLLPDSSLPGDKEDEEQEEEAAGGKENAPKAPKGTKGGRRSPKGNGARETAPRASASRKRPPKDILESDSEGEEEEEEEVEEDKDKGTEKETEESSQEASVEGSQVGGSGEDISMEDTQLMAGLVDTMLVLWMSISHDLNKEGNKELKRKLQVPFSHYLPVFCRAFRDERILNALILLAAFLPPNAVPMISRSMLSKLKSLNKEAEEEEDGESGVEPQEPQYATMLQAMCKWGKVQSILDLINEWLESALVTETDANKSRRRRSSSRRVGFVEPATATPRPGLALCYLEHLTAHAQCRRALLLAPRHTLTQLTDTLAKAMECIVQRVRAQEPLGEHCSDDVLLQAFQAYLKMQVLLSQQADTNDTDAPSTTTTAADNTNTTTCLATMQHVITWAEKELLSLLKPPSKKRGHNTGKRLMNPMDATLLAGDPSSSSSASLLQQTIADHTATATTLSQSLFETTLGAGLGGLGGGGGGVKRGAAGGALDMGIKIIQAIVTVCGNMLLVGIGDDDLASKLADFAAAILDLDRGCELTVAVVGMLYQVLEWSLSNQDTMTLPASVLSRLIVWLAKLAKNRKEVAARVLPGVRPAMLEMLSSYYRALPLLAHTPSTEVTATMVRAVSEEVTDAIKQDAHFEECGNVSTLPLLSAFLLGMMAKKDVFMRLFVSELTTHLSEESSSVERRLAALHLILALSPDNRAAAITKDCLHAIQSHMEANPLPADVSEESPLHVKITANKDLLKKCMAKTGMVA